MNESSCELIRNKRVEKGYKQTRLADETGLSQSYISSIENNKISPKLEDLIIIAEKLETNPYDLLPKSSFQISNNTFHGSEHSHQYVGQITINIPKEEMSLLIKSILSEKVFASTKK